MVTPRVYFITDLPPYQNQTVIIVMVNQFSKSLCISSLPSLPDRKKPNRNWVWAWVLVTTLKQIAKWKGWTKKLGAFYGLSVLTIRRIEHGSSPGRITLKTHLSTLRRSSYPSNVSWATSHPRSCGTLILQTHHCGQLVPEEWAGVNKPTNS